MRRASAIAEAGIAVALAGTILAWLPAAGAEALRYDRFALPKETLLVAGAALVATALAAARVRPTRSERWLVGFVMLSALSSLSACNCWSALRALSLTGAGVALFVGARALPSRHRLLGWAQLAAVAAAAATLMEALGVVRLSIAGRVPGGLEGNRNFAAHVFAITLPLALWRAAAVPRPRVVALAATAATTAALTLSHCRGAWLAGAAGLAVTALLLRPAVARPRLAVALVAVAAGVLLALAVPARGAWAHSFGETVSSMAQWRRGSAAGRLLQWSRTVELARSHPLAGVGPGNWAIAYAAHAEAGDPSFSPSAAQPVNRLPNGDWLGLAAERGLPAAGLLLVTTLALARGWQRRWRDGDDEARATAAVALGTLAAIAVAGSFDAVLTRATPLALAAVILGALAAEPSAVDPRAADRPRRHARAFTLAVALLGGAATALLACCTGAELALCRGGDDALAQAARLDRGNYRVRLLWGERAWAAGDCATATRAGGDALRLHPGLRRAERLLAACREGRHAD